MRTAIPQPPHVALADGTRLTLTDFGFESQSNVPDRVAIYGLGDAGRDVALLPLSMDRLLEFGRRCITYAATDATVGSGSLMGFPLQITLRGETLVCHGMTLRPDRDGDGHTLSVVRAGPGGRMESLATFPLSLTQVRDLGSVSIAYAETH